MKQSRAPLWRIYGISWLITIILFGFVGLKAGLSGLLVVIILSAIEITFSFDNAVVNAKILQKMTPFWQRMFMTVGIIIAVFGVRILLPLMIVAMTARLGFTHVVDLALNHPVEYAHHLENAHHLITAFGAAFLLMLFLDFILEPQHVMWLRKIETFFIRIGKLQRVSLLITLLVIAEASLWLAPEGKELEVLLAGLTGLVAYIVINTIDALFAYDKPHAKVTASNALKAGLASFFYLEMIDASFSLDGVIGAFAITDNILFIAIGLGVGAIYVRSLTVHMLRRGILGKYIYLEHGAHYAVGVLALVMLASLKVQIPDAVAGVSGMVVIIASILHSHRQIQTS